MITLTKPIARKGCGANSYQWRVLRTKAMINPPVIETKRNQ